MNDRDLKLHIGNVREMIMRAAVKPEDIAGMTLALGASLGAIDLLLNRLRLEPLREAIEKDTAA